MRTLDNFLHTNWEVISVFIEPEQLYEDLLRRKNQTTKARQCGCPVYFFLPIWLLDCRVCSHQIDCALLCDYLFWLLADVRLWCNAASSVLYPDGTLLPVEGPTWGSNQTASLTSFLYQLTSQMAFFSGQPVKQLVPPTVWASQPNLKHKVFFDRKAN